MQNGSGFIKLHRSFLDGDTWPQLTGDQLKVFVALLLKARWAKGEFRLGNGRAVSIPPGGVAITRGALSLVTGLTERTVGRALKKLENLGVVTVTELGRTGSRRHMLYVLDNWEHFQSDGEGRSPCAVDGVSVADRSLDVSLDMSSSPNIRNKEIKKNPPTPLETSKPETLPDAALAVADQLRESILRHNPKHRCANPISWEMHLRRQWADVAKAAHSADGREYADLLQLAKWLPDAPRRGKDRFCWADAISGAVSLREKFDDLWVEMTKKAAENGAGEAKGAYTYAVAGTEFGGEVHPDLARREAESRAKATKRLRQWCKGRYPTEAEIREMNKEN